MIANLRANRASFDHAPTKGAAIEAVWLKYLKRYLPNRYCVDSAIIIDHTGEISEQIDLVIYDQQYTPFIFEQDGAKYIPAEGVYAVFEVKPDLQGSAEYKGTSVSYIQYAGKKIASVRRLSRTSTMIVDRGVPKPPRPLTKILGGILTIESTFAKRDTIVNHFRSCTGIESIDIGCCADYASFFVEYDGQEDSDINDLQNRILGYYNSRVFSCMNFSNREESLVTFFLQLSRYLQQAIGTVAAIDLASYAKNLDFKIDKEI